MKLQDNTLLITGGSDGVGLALARMLAADNTVIICGRDAQRLARAKAAIPALYTEICDLTDPVQRNAMVDRVLAQHPRLNVLINNAGAKCRTELRTNDGVELAMHDDMALNFTAPVALCSALLPQLQSHPEAAIVNITTGLVFLPKAEQTFYCAAKAALHSYTQSLRWACKGSGVGVHEVMLSLVDTGFHQGRLPTNIRAQSPEQAAARIVRGLRRGEQEIRVGKAALARWLALFAPGRGMAIVNRP